MSEWQPIETAPKDGSKVLVAGGDTGYSCPTVLSAVFENGAWWPDQWESPDSPISPAYWCDYVEPPK